MCQRFAPEMATNAKAYFRKGNEPADMAYWFKVEAVQCECGQSWWVKPKGMRGWTQAEKVEPAAVLNG